MHERATVGAVVEQFEVIGVFQVFKGHDATIRVVVAVATADIADGGIGIAVFFGDVKRQCTLHGKDAVLVVVVAAKIGATFVVLGGEDAAVFAVPDDSAVAHAAVEVVQFGVFFQDDGGSLRFAVVLIVVLDDVATVGGFAKDDAVITTGGCLVDGGAARVEIVGFFIARGVIKVDDARLFGAQDAVRQGGSEAWRQGVGVDTDGWRVVCRGSFFWRRGERYGKGKAKNDGELDHGHGLRLGKMRIIWGFLWLFREEIGADKGAEGNTEDAAEQHFAVVA